MEDTRKNAEGYSDPTPHEAMGNWVAPDEHNAWRVKQTIRNLADLAGYTIECEIVLKNKKTRKVYK